jgi:hypothetical protein
MSGSGMFDTCRPVLPMSVRGGRPEVSGVPLDVSDLLIVFFFGHRSFQAAAPSGPVNVSR